MTVSLLPPSAALPWSTLSGLWGTLFSTLFYLIFKWRALPWGVFLSPENQECSLLRLRVRLKPFFWNTFVIKNDSSEGLLSRCEDKRRTWTRRRLLSFISLSLSTRFERASNFLVRVFCSINAHEALFLFLNYAHRFMFRTGKSQSQWVLRTGNDEGSMFLPYYDTPNYFLKWKLMSIFVPLTIFLF